MESKIYRVALVGCGVVSRNHIKAILKVPNVRLVALCDNVPEKAIALKENLSLDVDIYDNYEAMLDAVKPDSVHIATPHHLHCSMAKAALERDIEVFLEKPVCITVDDVNTLIETEKASKASVCVCFQNRFVSAVSDAMRIIDEDGGVLSAYCSLFWKRDEEYYNSASWRGKYATEGGGVMINQAIHTIDLLTRFLGIPKSVIATKSNHHLKNVIEVEDSCEGIIYFENGKSANFYATTSSVGADDALIVLKTRNHTIDLRLPNITVDGVMTNYSADTHVIGKACYGNGHQLLIAHYYHALEMGKPSPVPIESAQYALRIVLAAYKSNDKEILV